MEKLGSAEFFLICCESILENTLKEVDLILEESVGLKSQIKPIEGEEK